MEKQRIELEGCEGWYISRIKLSQRLRWHDDSKKDGYNTIPSLLSMCVVDEKGEPVKTLEEWDEWGGESKANLSLATKLFDQCMDVIGRVEDAKKN